MAITKIEMQIELMDFMQGYVRSFRRMFWKPNAPSCEAVFDQLAQPVEIKQTVLWQVAGEMYDYGILGIHGDAFGDCLDGSYADVELFIRGLDSLKTYFEEDGVQLPWITSRVVRTAVARHVLDGGERYTNFGYIESNSTAGDFGLLSLQEIALLADMDERSVRNAASQKQFAIESVGKRTLVACEEARRWLTGRKGFVPTTYPDRTDTQSSSTDTEKMVNVSLPARVMKLLELRAIQRNMSVAEILEDKMFNL